MPKVVTTLEDVPPMPAARTPEERERQLIALATDLVERRLREGTATSQEIVHFLKLGCTQAKADLEKTELEKELLKAKCSAIERQEHSDEMYTEALRAMREYAGADNE